jgi:hypothetical protein
MRNVPALLIVCLLVYQWSCRSLVEVAPVVDLRERMPPQASIVSVLPTELDAAEIQIKDSPGLKAPYILTGLTPTGNALSLSPRVEPVNPNPRQLPLIPYPFQLSRYRVTNLVVGQTYRFRLRFVYNNEDTITIERPYTHRPPGNWTRLAHLPADNGHFTGTPVAMDYDRAGTSISLFRYVDVNTTQTLLYYYSLDLWLNDTNAPSLLPTSRPGIIQFNLYFRNVDRYRFWGLGYQTSDLLPGKYIYLRDLYLETPPPYNKINTVVPSYLGEAGETAFFTTIDQAFFLTQNGSPALFAISSLAEQRPCRPLPELPGTLATFTIDSIGFIINQVGNRQPHLWAYDTRTDSWSRKSDFPGPVRSRGVGFSVKGIGYFGLGTTPQQDAGYRDIWQYDPATNAWQYLTDYPGQAHRYVVSLSTANRVFLGLGYEAQPSLGQNAATRQVGCTDFWEFKP